MLTTVTTCTTVHSNYAHEKSQLLLVGNLAFSKVISVRDVNVTMCVFLCITD